MESLGRSSEAYASEKERSLLLNIPAAWWTSSRRGLVQQNILQLNLEAKKTALCVLRPQFPTLSTTDTEEVAFCVHLFSSPIPRAH
jgi:hypothetical protein